ncbi:MAG: hypothetical protein LCH73_17005, partial [Proteobacteria bacterium]|nr:hypothetical protein [Pseudomonadota bacterium]
RRAVDLTGRDAWVAARNGWTPGHLALSGLLNGQAPPSQTPPPPPPPELPPLPPGAEAVLATTGALAAEGAGASGGAASGGSAAGDRRLQLRWGRSIGRDQEVSAPVAMVVDEAEPQPAARSPARRVRFEVAQDAGQALACEAELVANRLLVRVSQAGSPALAPALRKRVIDAALTAVEKTFAASRQSIAVTMLALVQ